MLSNCWKKPYWNAPTRSQTCNLLAVKQWIQFHLFIFSSNQEESSVLWFSIRDVCSRFIILCQLILNKLYVSQINPSSSSPSVCRVTAGWAGCSVYVLCPHVRCPSPPSLRLSHSCWQEQRQHQKKSKQPRNFFFFFNPLIFKHYQIPQYPLWHKVFVFSNMGQH